MAGRMAGLRVAYRRSDPNASHLKLLPSAAGCTRSGSGPKERRLEAVAGECAAEPANEWVYFSRPLEIVAPQCLNSESLKESCFRVRGGASRPWPANGHGSLLREFRLLLVSPGHRLEAAPLGRDLRMVLANGCSMDSRPWPAAAPRARCQPQTSLFVQICLGSGMRCQPQTSLFVEICLGSGMPFAPRARCRAGLLRLPRAKAGPDGWQPSRTREAMRVLGPAMPGLLGCATLPACPAWRVGDTELEKL